MPAEENSINFVINMFIHYITENNYSFKYLQIYYIKWLFLQSGDREVKIHGRRNAILIVILKRQHFSKNS